MTEAKTIHKTLILNANQETVWNFLTKREKLAQWFHPARTDLAEGEGYELLEIGEDGTESPICWGTVLEMQAPQLLRYTFTVKPLNGALTTVTWTLEDIGGATRLTLTHEGIEAAAGEAHMGLLLALDKGWDEHLATLRSSLTQ